MAASGRRRFGFLLGSALAGTLLVLANAAPARGIPVTLQFTVDNFPPTFAGVPAPFPTVSGTIVYEAADVTSTIESLTSISLQNGSHSYTVGELGFTASPVSTSHIIGGTLNGVTGVRSFTNDFSIQFDRVAQPGLGANFVYATTERLGIWRTTSFTSFSLTAQATPVAEPGTVGLIVLGSVLGMAAVRRRGSGRREVAA